ncbi:polysaccharide biosynthesis/export family protein [Sphingobium sp. LF-16]|uniref:polysaccharide biosynthesis/export family protein n=1 Tax=Sphingobium sp. LF-16 TaxID=2185111 RepID=UPI001F0C1C75|nr:polysaccharide biosynthesis/export family protein [Sphingobium sp. LF-16]
MLNFAGFPNSKPLIISLMAAAALPGCTTLPSSGPTSAQIVSRANDKTKEFRFNIVSLDSTAVDILNNAQNARIASVATLGSLAGPPHLGVLGPGDVLSINIYEVGVSLFSRTAAAGTGSFDPSAHGERFPEITVDQTGNISLPFIGTLKVAGSTTAQVEAMINRKLSTQSQYPQTMVTLAKNLTNTIIVAGNVNRPGRYDLTYNSVRVLDAIALAGGATASSEDTLIRFERAGRTIEQRLDSVRSSSIDDLLLEPDDHIELVKRPRSFTVFGAAGRVSQVSFDTGGVSLAEALARVQGPSDATANPSAVFIFRYDDTIDPASGEKPIIYRLNMLEPASYFLAQRVAMQDKDVIYIANAAANQPSKLISIINQIFSPIITARAITR